MDLKKKKKYNVKLRVFFFPSLQMGEEPRQLFTPDLYILKNNLYV